MTCRPVVDTFGFPFVLKPTISFPPDASVRLQAAEVINEAEAITVIQTYLSAGAGVLAQQMASGRREGVTLFIADGDVRAACAHVAHRTSPALGGASVLRESLPITEEIYGPAVSLVNAIGLEGVCEVEFRRDAGNRPLLMEVNARLAGTIENAVRSGVDFPLMIWQWATGLPVERHRGYKTGVRTPVGCTATCAGCGTTSGEPDVPTACPAPGRFRSSPPNSSAPVTSIVSTGMISARPWPSCAPPRGPSESRGPPSPPPRTTREHHVSTDEVLIIGAGPYGLSISAHLRGLGVSHRIVGRPMDTWRAHMPVGMNLKSEPYASDIAAPQAGYDVGAYCRRHGLDYAERLGPLSLERFLDYADWYTGQLVPDVTDITVTDVSPADGGFRVTFADAEPVTVRQVVVATGVLPFARIPDELSGLSSDLVSHSADHRHLDRFSGRRVAVIGAGQSALETAALLHEAGAEPQLIVRGPAINFVDPNPERLSRIGQIRRPATKLCEGWHCAVWNSPAAFRLLPQSMRITKARTVLGPAGSWWLKNRVEGVVDVLAGHQVRGAEPTGSGVRLRLEGPRQAAVDVDHVIAGTGFRVDVNRLTFLSDRLRAGIATLSNYPVVSRARQSSVPGLYFAGAPTCVSLGPSERFIGGTHNTARTLARSLASRADGNGHQPVDVPDRVPQLSAESHEPA